MILFVPVALNESSGKAQYQGLDGKYRVDTELNMFVCLYSYI